MKKTLSPIPLAACALVLSFASPAAETPTSAPSEPSAAVRSLRDAQDRPVLAFAQGPAALLLTREELLAYQELVDLGARRGFIERFWASMATNCMPGTNPIRDLFWERAQTARERFGDEGLPGWATDRGRFFILAGPPEREETYPVKTPAGNSQGMTWFYAPAEGRPSQIYFVQQRLLWVFAGAATAADAGRPETLEAQQWAPLSRTLAEAFRTQGCVLTPEQMAERARVAWRAQLYDEAGKVLAGETPSVTRPAEPQVYFFPAEGDSTLIWLVVPLDAPLPEGSRLVAMLRAQDGEDVAFALGTDDFPFEVRPSGRRYVGLAARPLPPGKYVLVIGNTAADGTTVVHHAASQLVARLPSDTLRTTSVVLAQEVTPLDAAADKDPFQIGDWRVMPRADRTIPRGENFWLVYKVLGASKDAAGRNNLQVSYQFKGKMQGGQWQNIGDPVVRDLTSDTTAIEFPTSPKWPPTAEYKVELQVLDRGAGGAPFKIDVPFSIKG